MQKRSAKRLGDAAGLTQFGANLVTIDAGRHLVAPPLARRTEDELVLVLDGALTLVEDAGETPIGPGEAAAFPAGAAERPPLAATTAPARRRSW